MRTLHLVSHTHWDREWYQTFQQFRIKLVHLVDGLLDILEQDEFYSHYMLDGQTIVLEDYLQVRPEKEQLLRQYVQNGRLIIGPWYILPDEFLVSPEATVRNLLEGERTAKSFGPKMMVGYIPDPFGHIGQMPQILRGFGIQTASVMRGLSDEPCEFWWQSPDGSRVLMAYLRDGYGNAAGILNKNLENFARDVGIARDALAPHARAPHLLLMQGTDHMQPVPLTPEAIAFTQGKLDGDRLVHSTLPDYLACVLSSVDGAKLPVVAGELRSSKRHPLLPGVLSARMWIKQRNHTCETLLEKWAEPFSVWARGVSSGSQPSDTLRAPSAALRQAWRLLMQCHPHDSICGCSIDQVHEEMRPRFDQVEQIAEEITRQSLQALALSVDTQGGPRSGNGELLSSVIVFNPTQGARRDAVSAVLEALPDTGSFELVDEKGAALPFQTVGLGSSEMINMEMDAKELRGGFAMVADGILMGTKIREIHAERQGSQASISIVVREMGEPDLAAWERGRQEVEKLLDDPSISRYNVRVRSAEATQVFFSAPDVPGLGYRTFWARSKPAAPKAPVRINPLARAMLPMATRLAAHPLGQRLAARLFAAPASKPPYTIENEFFRVEARRDGTLDILDRRSGRIFSGQNRLVDGGDRGDTYNYSPPVVDLLVTARLKSARVERGPVRQVIELSLELVVPESLASDRKSRVRKMVTLPITSRVTLTRGVARVEIHTEVENAARDHRLRVHFPAPFLTFQAEHDGHFEVVRRPVDVPQADGSWVEQPRPEVPQRAFTCIADEETVLLLASLGLPEVQVLRDQGSDAINNGGAINNGSTEIALTLLRCVGWLSRDDFPERKGHAGPFMATPGAQMSGKWAFEYAVVPGIPEELRALAQLGYAFQAPLRAISAALQPGSIPGSAAFLQVQPDDFIISVVKAAEHGEGFVVRGYNVSDHAVPVTLTTLRPFQSAERVNLAEEVPAAAEPPALLLANDRSVRFDARAHEIVTIHFVS